MFGTSDTITGAIIGAVAGFAGLVIGLIVNSLLEKRKAQQQRIKDIRLRLIGDRLLALEVIDFIKSQRKISFRIIPWVEIDEKLSRYSYRSFREEYDIEGRKEKEALLLPLFKSILHRNIMNFIDFYGSAFKRFIENDNKRKERNRPDLSWARLNGIKLRMQDLNNVVFFNSDLSEADLVNANLKKADFRKANLNKADLGWTQLDDALFLNAELSNSNLKSAKLYRVVFSEVDLTGSNLEIAELYETHFSKAKINNANFHFAKSFNSYISDSDLNSSDFSYSDFAKTVVRTSSFENVDFGHSKLYKCRLYDVKLKLAKFCNARLRNVIFSNADFSEVDFTDVGIRDVIMIDANLEGATINQDQLELITFGENIILPNGEKKYYPPEINKVGHEKIVKYSGKVTSRIIDFDMNGFQKKLDDEFFEKRS